MRGTPIIMHITIPICNKLTAIHCYTLNEVMCYTLFSSTPNLSIFRAMDRFYSRVYVSRPLEISTETIFVQQEIGTSCFIHTQNPQPW